MKSLYTTLLALIVLSINAQPPANYYAPVQGLSGTQLKVALHNIIDDHDVQSYSSLWTHFQSTDKKNDGSVWDMYSDIPGSNPPYVFTFVTDQCGNYGGEGDCYNREHSWPKSWFNDQAPMNSDLYHLYPTDGYVNNRRGNYPFGEVGNATWASENGSLVGNCNYPGYNGTVFEPIDAYKGDFARTYFYMSIRYYGEDAGWEGSPQADGAELTAWSLAMLKEWHEADPVSQKEINRNNAVYQIQNNRNPFIDHPEFVNMIWGGPTGITEKELNRNVKVYPVPSVDYCIVDHAGYYNPNDISITIFDLTGRQYVVSYTTDMEVVKIDSHSLGRGFYFISIKEDGKKPAFIRMVK